MAQGLRGEQQVDRIENGIGGLRRRGRRRFLSARHGLDAEARVDGRGLGQPGGVQPRERALVDLALARHPRGDGRVQGRRTRGYQVGQQ